MKQSRLTLSGEELAAWLSTRKRTAVESSCDSLPRPTACNLVRENSHRSTSKNGSLGAHAYMDNSRVNIKGQCDETAAGLRKYY